MQTDLYLQCPAEQRGLYAKLARQHTDVDLRAHRRSSEGTGREMIPNRLLQKGQFQFSEIRNTNGLLYYPSRNQERRLGRRGCNLSF